MTDALECLAQAPLAIAPRYLGYMLSVLQGRSSAVAPRMPMLRGRRVEGTVLVDDIAVIPIVGPIVQRPDLFGMFGGVSVHDIRATVGAAIEDPGVAGVLLVVDSPGGEVAGVADVADAIFAARRKKPMMAIADEGIFSAAYWIASAVGPIAVPRTGSVGSIGALVVHTDVSQALDKMGVKMTVIKSGAKKAQFSPFAPLTAEAKGALQGEVDRIAGLFFEAVARHRGVTAEQLASFEGGTFEGDAAVEAGLADAVDTVDGAFLAMKMHLLAAPSARTMHAKIVDIGARRERTDTMDLKESLEAAAAGSGTPQPPKLPESVDGPPAVQTPWAGQTNVINIAEARKQARDEAAKAERTRATEIMHWCAFARKPDLAEHYMGSTMTIEQVRADLATQTVELGDEIGTTRPLGLSAPRQYDSVEVIYARRRASIEEAKRNRRWL